jgi:hypothetical protein
MEGHIEVADIFRGYGPAYREVYGKEMPQRHHRAMHAIEICRTSKLGGHVDECDECGALRISYNSCRNRHCPKCQCLDKERWLESRKSDVLPTQYFHVVFTNPEELSPLSLRNQKAAYNIHFKAASETLQELSDDPRHLGARVGFIGILHTWSQTLIHHPHIHFIVPGGGLSPDSTKWISCKKDFFIRVEVLSRLFRGKYLYYLKKAYYGGELKFPGLIENLKGKRNFEEFCSDLYSKEWVVDSRPSFKTSEDVIDYLGRYTHRVAITNDRIVKVENDQVTFKYRDRKDDNKVKLITLDAFTFIRRFLFHVLPDGFMKIRHYGILSNRNRKDKLLICKDLLGVEVKDRSESVEKESWEDLLLRITGIDYRICPSCKKGKMVPKEKLLPGRKREPP